MMQNVRRIVRARKRAGDRRRGDVVEAFEHARVYRLNAGGNVVAILGPVFALWAGKLGRKSIDVISPQFRTYQLRSYPLFRELWVVPSKYGPDEARLDGTALRRRRRTGERCVPWYLLLPLLSLAV